MQLKPLILSALALIMALDLAATPPVAEAALPIDPTVVWHGTASSADDAAAPHDPSAPAHVILASTQAATAASLSQADVLERIERRLRAVPDYPPYLYEIKRLSDAIAVVWMDLTARRHAAYDQSYYAAIDYIERERLALIRARRLAGDGELRAAIDLLGEAERFRKISHAFTEAAQAAFESDIATGEYWAKAAYESSRAAAIFAGAVHGPAGMQAVDALFLASDFFVDWTQVGLEQAAVDTFSRAATKLLLTQVPLPTIQAETGNALAASFNHHFAGRTFEAALANGSTTILGAQVAPYIAAALEAPATRERLLALLMGGVEHTLARHLVGPAVDAAFAGYLATLTEQQPAEQATELATRMEAAGLQPAQQALAQEILEAFDGDIDTIRLVASHAEHAWLAAAAYGDERGQPYQRGTSLPLPGWTVADVFLIENTFTGDLSAKLFSHEDGRVVLAYRGTESAGDWVTNFAAVTGIPTSQIVQAEEIAKSIAFQHPDVVFVGHSLGGRLANIARKITGKDAVVFNPAPHSVKELSMKSAGGSLLAFRSPDDRVSVLTATRDIEVANFHRYDTANSLLRTGPELWYGLKYDHKMNYLAAAMRVVEIALPWIEQALGTAVAAATELPDLSTADGLQTACSAGNAESCVTLGEVDAGESDARLPETPSSVRMVAHGFDNQGIDFVSTVLIRRVEAGVEVVLEELIGSHAQGATFNPVESDASFSIGLHVIARRNCEGCRPTFTRQSEPVGEFANGGIEVTNLPVSVLIPEADIGQADEIGWAVWGGSTLFLFQNSEIALAELMRHRDDRAVEQEVAVATGDVDRPVAPEEKTLQAACTAGNAESCNNLGRQYQLSENSEPDLARAADYYQLACEGGSAWGCTNLGMLYRDGQGVDQDFTRAAGLFRQGCDGAIASACTNLGWLHVYGHGIAQDLELAANHYQKGCDGDDAFACSRLGWLYRHGQGVEPDLARSAELQRKACTAGDAFGCRALGGLYQDGLGVEQNPTQAAEHFQKGCKAGDAAACHLAALLYEDGRGVEKNATRAIDLYGLACDGGDWRGCNNLGVLYRDGRGVEQNQAKAASLFQQACDGGFETACSRQQERPTTAAAVEVGVWEGEKNCRFFWEPWFATSFGSGPQSVINNYSWEGECTAGEAALAHGEGVLFVLSGAIDVDGQYIDSYLLGPGRGHEMHNGRVVSTEKKPLAIVGNIARCNVPMSKIEISAQGRDLGNSREFERVAQFGLNTVIEFCFNQSRREQNFKKSFGLNVHWTVNVIIQNEKLSRPALAQYTSIGGSPLPPTNGNQYRYRGDWQNNVLLDDRLDDLRRRNAVLFFSRLRNRAIHTLDGDAPLENVAEVVFADRTRSAQKLAIGRRIVLRWSNPDFRDGVFQVSDLHHVEAIRNVPPEKVTLRSTDYRNLPLSVQQLVGGSSPAFALSVVCRLDPSDVQAWSVGQLVEVHAKLLEMRDNAAVFDCDQAIAR